MSKTSYKLRKVNIKDLDLIYAWSNDTFVRKNSFDKNKISLLKHENWFKNILRKKDSIFIFCKKDLPLGLIRFVYFNRGLKISYMISKDFRGKGIAKIMIKEFIKKIRKKNLYRTKKIFAFVINKNYASSITLENSGFIYSGLKYGSHCYINI